MFYQSNKAWLTPAFATLIVVMADLVARRFDAALWGALAPAWLLPAALVLGGLATGFRARLTDTVAARLACIAAFVCAAVGILAKVFG